MKVAIITCGADKQSSKCLAKEMYKGSLFVASRKFAESNYEKYCILSAKYHVLMPDDLIEPYDMFLGNFTKQEKEDWWNETTKQLLEKFPEDTEYHFYAGKTYIEGVVPQIEGSGRECKCFLNNLGMGYKIQWFKQHTKRKGGLF